MADPQKELPPTLTFPTDPSEFDSDERISFSKLDNKFIAVHDDGTEFEFDSQLKRWIPALDEELVRQQQLAYGGGAAAEDDDYNQQQQYQRNRKRKKGDPSNGSPSSDQQQQQRPSKKQQRQSNQQPPKNTAVYVTGLPLDATAEEVHEVFSRKCGVVAEEIDSGRPRIKMYADEAGRFKGDALVVFFKPQSVDMAIMLLDDTDFRYTPSGLATGRMRVQPADSSYKKTNYDNRGSAAEGVGGAGGGEDKGAAADGGGGGGGGGGSGTEKTENGSSNNNNNKNGGSDPRIPKDSRTREQEKQKIIKRTQKLDAKLADWDDDDGPYAGFQPEAANKNNSSKNGSSGGSKDRLVILRHMFTLRELEEDPAALLEIKEDVRDECSKLGPVTNVVLYDLEPDGVVAVKFRHPEAAEACVRLMDGRAFDGRIVRAALAGAGGRDHRNHRFRRSDKEQNREGEEEEEKEEGEGEDVGADGNENGEGKERRREEKKG